MDWLSYISGLAATPIVVGLSAWFGKVWASRILEKDRARYRTEVETLLADLRTRDTKELYVHRLQFEKEFEVYKELWVAALQLARAGSNFRDFQMGPVKTEEQVQNEVVSAYRRLEKIVFECRPFYAPKVYETANGMLNDLADVLRIRRELGRLEKRIDSDADADRAVAKDMAIERKLDAINGHVDTLCDAIRRRIWSTSATGYDRRDAELSS